MSIDWRELLAIGIVAGDLRPRSIARHAGVSAVDVEKALVEARAAGILVDTRELRDASDDGGVLALLEDADVGVVDPDVAAELVGSLPAQQIAEIHAVVGRTLLLEGTEHVEEAVHHLRAAATLLPADELLPVAEHSARMCLSFGAYEAATALFRLATDLDDVQFDREHVRHLLGLSRALAGVGRVHESQEIVLEACDLAIRLDDADLAAEAVIQFVFPVGWKYSDRRAVALLDRVRAMELEDDTRLAVDAVRAMAESWLATSTAGDQQLAWVSRPTVAQPMADAALAAALDPAVEISPRTRLTVLLAWRWTHRGPEFLERRREYSSEALDLAQILGETALTIESAIANAVDSLESADRAQYERALTVARWLADHDSNPLVRWRTDTVVAGSLHLDGEVELAAEARVATAATAAAYGVPGWLAAERLGLAQELWRLNDPVLFATVHIDDDEPALAHPAGQVSLAMVLFHRGERDRSEELLRRVLRTLDPEASMLLVAALATDVALVIDDRASMARLVDILEPFTHHVAIDARGWWCPGPVSLYLALLHQALGNDRRARVLVGLAEVTAREINDVRSMERARALRGELGDGDDETVDGFGLTDRERAILRRITEGRTNPHIAAELAFSVSTIRMDTISIYRKLGVSGRKEATAKVVATGLIDLL